MAESVQGLNEKYGAAVKCLWRVTKLWASAGGRGRIPSQPFPALPVVSQTEGSCERAEVLTASGRAIDSLHLGTHPSVKGGPFHVMEFTVMAK